MAAPHAITGIIPSAHDEMTPGHDSGSSFPVAFFGLFGIGNIGNEATLRTTLEQLNTRAPDAIPLVICPGPQRVSATHGVPTIDWNPVDFAAPKSRPRSRMMRWVRKPFLFVRNFWLMHRTVSRCSLFVVPGTGVLDDYALSDHTMPITLLLWCLAARLARVPVIFASIGAGPINDSLSRHLMKLIARLATERSYRDDYSKHFLEGLGIDTRMDRVLPDLAFIHAIPAALQPPTEVRRHPLTVGLGMMSYFGWTGNAETGGPIYQAYLTKMAAFAVRLMNDGFTIRFLVGRESDNRAIDDLIRNLPALTGDSRYVRSPMNNMDELLAEISQCDVVVATRFHNVVAALMLGTPTLSIGYSEKNDAVMQGCGIGQLCQAIEVLDGRKLLEQFNETVAQRMELRRVIERRVAQHRAILTSYFDALFSPGRISRGRGTP